MNETKQEKRKKKLFDKFGKKSLLAVLLALSLAFALLMAVFIYGLIFKALGIKNVLIFFGVFSAFYLMAHMMFDE